jgi:hypothetical protein
MTVVNASNVPLVGFSQGPVPHGSDETGALLSRTYTDRALEATGDFDEMLLEAVHPGPLAEFPLAPVRGIGMPDPALAASAQERYLPLCVDSVRYQPQSISRRGLGGVPIIPCRDRGARCAPLPCSEKLHNTKNGISVNGRNVDASRDAGAFPLAGDSKSKCAVCIHIVSGRSGCRSKWTG